MRLRVLLQGEDFQVVDNVSGRDLTAATLAQVIFEEEMRCHGFPWLVWVGIIRTGQIP